MPCAPPPPFHPVVVLPPGYVVLDLSGPGPYTTPAPWAPTPWAPTPWAIGRYDEQRGIYSQALFQGEGEPRSLHVGIDLGGPAGTAVHAFTDGFVLHAGYNPAEGDYGHVLVTEQRIDGQPVWALFGHLCRASIGHSPPGRRFQAGEVLGWMGEQGENGGWPPHLHFQLSIERPETHDLPGAVRPSERAQALRRFPDPRCILGPLY